MLTRSYTEKMGERWADKWTKGLERWEDRRAVTDTSEDTLRGIPAPTGKFQDTYLEMAWKDLVSKGNVGRTVDVRFDPDVAGPTLPVLEIRCSDNAARELTLTLQKFEPQIVGVTGQAGRAYFARVEWGVGGFNNSADVDFLNGQTLNLSATFIRVFGIADAIAANGVGVQKLGAFVSPGHRRGGRAPQRTVNVGTAAAAGGNTINAPIPNYAYQGFPILTIPLAILPTVPPAGEVRFRRHNLNICAKYEIDDAAAAPFAGVTPAGTALRFPNETRFVSYVNTDAANAWAFSMVFDLDL